MDYLLISAANASGWDDVLRSAKRAGVRVILFDRAIDTDPSNYEAALLSDMHYEGRLATDWVLNNVPKPINVVLIRGQLGSAAEIGRSAPLLKAAEEGNLTLWLMEPVETLGALRKPVKWLKPQLPRGFQRHLLRTTVWRKELFRR